MRAIAIIDCIHHKYANENQKSEENTERKKIIHTVFNIQIFNFIEGVKI